MANGTGASQPSSGAALSAPLVSKPRPSGERQRNDANQQPNVNPADFFAQLAGGESNTEKLSSDSENKLNLSPSSTLMDLIIRQLDGRVDKCCQYHEIEALASHLGSRTSREIVFVTGNKNKVAELDDHIKTKLVKFDVLDLDLPEIQDANVLNIVEEKCKSAFEKVNSKLTVEGDGQQAKRCVLIEDTCLHFKALNGMPGPYIKWFLNAVGPSGLHKMLAGYENKSAEAVCIYALMDDESRIVFCKGSVRGRITSPRGSSWGWDPVFEEERSGMTFGEMDSSMKFKFSHRSNAITVLKKFLTIGES